MNNRYVNRSKISEAKFRELLRLFSLDLTAKQISEVTGLNRNTVNRYLKGVRERISEYCDAASPVEVFTRKGSVNSEKTETTTIGLTEIQNNVFITFPDQEVIEKFREKGGPEGISNHQILNYVRLFDILFDIETEWHFSLRKWKGESSHAYRKKYNRLEGFIGFLKNRISKFRGMQKSTLYLHLKETEFRYNYRNTDIYSLLLRILRKRPLF